MFVTVRFAPSPTGFLHVGNARVALVNWLFARRSGGRFLLRLDDTDTERSRPEFAEAIRRDLRWLGLDWDAEERQSDRLERYRIATETLKAQGRLYPCYETPQELEFRRKRQLARHQPPVYDRAALGLTEDQRRALEAEGRRPHWRFRLDDADIAWTDLVRGPVHFQGGHLSDPVVIREDGTFLYMLPSVVDDVDMRVSHVIRGEDHVANTAVQVQMFEALGTPPPTFAHLPLMTDIGGEGLSKRLGSLSLADLREQGVEALALASYLAHLGTSDAIEPQTTHEALIAGFELSHCGRASPKFDAEQLWRLNEKLLHALPFTTVAPRLAALGLAPAEEVFWEAVRPNLRRLADAAPWHGVCYGEATFAVLDQAPLKEAIALLPPEPWSQETWKAWTQAVSAATGRKGKALFLPLRQALTGQDHGPELKALLPVIGRDRALARLTASGG
ncbi:MAG: glutamate--tRNA ligase [Magnetospirillum sp. WYHS-4]